MQTLFMRHDRDVVDCNADRDANGEYANEYADACGYDNAHSDAHSRSDRNSDRDVGHTKVNPDDRAEQDADHGGHLYDANCWRLAESAADALTGNIVPHYKDGRNQHARLHALA